MLPRERLIETATHVYRSFGFCPIDTPALEYLEILQGKENDETDKQFYQFTDHGNRQVGLRFDLTVPLARYTAQHFAITMLHNVSQTVEWRHDKRRHHHTDE